MLALVGRRKPVLVCTAIALLLLFCSRSPSPPGRAYPPAPEQRASHATLEWSNVPQHYPVHSVAALPTSTAKIPLIQHQFAAEDAGAREVRLQRQQAVKDSFLHAWNGYKRHAWLSDEVSPLSGRAANPFGGWAATLVDALDTLWIMGLKDEFDEAVRAIDQIDFTTCSLETLNVFETTIRYLGGFLAAYDLSHGQYPALLHKATELGSMLYKAFDTPNRMPQLRWNFKAAAKGFHQEAHVTVLVAEIGSLTLEFTRLSQLTGDARYYDAVQRVMDVFEAQQNYTRLPGLWPVVVDAKNQDFTSFRGRFTLGGMVDSLYEYFPKQHMLLGGATDQYRNCFNGFAKPMKKHMLYRPMNPENKDILMAGDISTDGEIPPKMVYLNPRNEHLSCFAGGMFAIAGKIFDSPEDLEVGRKLTEGCLWAYEVNPHGIMPEIMYTVPCSNPSACEWEEESWLEAIEIAHTQDGADFVEADRLVVDKHLRQGIVKVDDPQYILRPEAIESVFILYRINGDKTLPDRAWNMFRKITKLSKTKIAHAALDNCLTGKPRQRDSMESFWLAETLKYFYLIFSEPNLVSLDEYVLNTEAHPLKRTT